MKTSTNQLILPLNLQYIIPEDDPVILFKHYALLTVLKIRKIFINYVQIEKAAANSVKFLLFATAPFLHFGLDLYYPAASGSS